MARTRQKLNKRSDLRRVVNNDSRAKKKRVRIQRNAAGGGVITAEVADDTDKGDRLIGERTNDTVLAEVRPASQVKVGVADGGVERLGVRRNGKEEQRQAK